MHAPMEETAESASRSMEQETCNRASGDERTVTQVQQDSQCLKGSISAAEYMRTRIIVAAIKKDAEANTMISNEEKQAQ
jgi:hypothetical protein